MNRALAVALGIALARMAYGQQGTTAESLLGEIKANEDWLAKAKSFHGVYDVEQLSIRAEGAATRSMTETPATAPAQHTEHYQGETAFDATRFYGRLPLNFGSRVVFFDGKVAGMSQRDGFFDVTALTDNVKQNFTRSLPWGRNGQDYWWQVQQNQKHADYPGPADANAPAAARDRRLRVMLMPRTTSFHGVACYEVECDLSVADQCTLYIGAEDHRLYGQFSLTAGIGIREIDWFGDYKEVAKNCWYPMTIGHDEMVPAGLGAAAVPGAVPPIDTYRIIRRVKNIEVDKPLPEELFAKAIPDGSHVHDTAQGAAHDYVFRLNQSAEEKAEIEANAARQKLFAPPQHVPGASVVLGEPVAPLPLNPLALQPAVEFPADAKWVGGDPKKLADLKGKVVLIYFWATWQDYAEGLLRPTAPDYSVPDAIKGDVVVIGVHVPTTEPARVQKAMQDHHMNFPVCIDAGVPKSGWGTMAEQYRVDELPVTYVVDQAGKVATWGTWAQAVQAAGELAGKP
jgi:hypothetical protein